MSKIHILPIEPEHKPLHTCKRCGANTFSSIVLTVHQYASTGCGYSVALVCVNCKNIVEINERKG